MISLYPQPPPKHGARLTRLWPLSTRRMSSGCRPAWPAANPKVSAACWNCTAAAVTDCWSGPTCGRVGLVRGGAGTALVGSHADVAERLAEYAQLGITHFILSGYPHLEEAYWFGEGVLPLLEQLRLWEAPQPRPAAGPGDAVLRGRLGPLVMATTRTKRAIASPEDDKNRRRVSSAGSRIVVAARPAGHHRRVVRLLPLRHPRPGWCSTRCSFPTPVPWVGTLLAFATFAVGFVMRPIGGRAFGHIGDRTSAASGSLALTMLIMGIATDLDQGIADRRGRLGCGRGRKG